MTRRFYNRFCTSVSNKFKKVFFPALTTSELQVAMLRTMIKKILMTHMSQLLRRSGEVSQRNVKRQFLKMQMDFSYICLQKGYNK